MQDIVAFDPLKGIVASAVYGHRTVSQYEVIRVSRMQVASEEWRATICLELRTFQFDGGIWGIVRVTP